MTQAATLCIVARTAEVRRYEIVMHSAPFDTRV
jgi:hypothetical protein